MSLSKLIKSAIPGLVGGLAGGLLSNLFESSEKKKFSGRGFQNKSKRIKRGEIRSAFHRDKDWDF